MDQSEVEQIGGEAEQTQGSERRRWKWGILLAAVLAATAAALLYFKQSDQGLNEQLKALAVGRPGHYYEEVQGPGWYVKLAKKYELPVPKQPVTFCSEIVTDEDMAVVGRAKTLHQVVLLRSKISDAGLVHLRGLTGLQRLSLSGTDIGDEGVAHLSELTELWELSLRDTKVSDAGLVHLKKLKNLKLLSLRGTQVTDKGLPHLKSLKALVRLELLSTSVTAEGVADLKSAIPDAYVISR